MVRLREKAQKLIRRVNRQFQFQYGAIKSQELIIEYESSLWFQFEYGAIKSYEFFNSINFSFEFQFQYGAIKR